MKKVAWLLVVALLVLTLGGCAAKAPATLPDTDTDDKTQTETVTKTDVNIVAINGPTGVGMANLWADADEDKTENAYHISTVTAPDQAVAAILNKSADIVAVPTNLAATLYKKTEGKVQVLAANTRGVLYVLENGNTIESLDDLRGKTIYTTGQGANPEYILRYLLTENDLTNDVTIEFVAENTELSTLLINNTASIALVPEPLATTVMTKNPNLRVALDINDEWEAVSDNGLVMGCVVARSEFVNENPEAVKTFLKEYKASIDQANENIETTATRCENYGIIAAAALAQKAIPRCQLICSTGADMKAQLVGFYNVLFAANPVSIGGALPADEFYYGA